MTMMNELMKNKIKNNPDEAVQLATKMEVQSREMIQNMNDIVWSINPNNDNVELLATRLNQYAADAFDTTDTLYKIELLQNGINKINGLGIRRDVYMICKEIITNTAKDPNIAKIVLKAVKIVALSGLLFFYLYNTINSGHSALKKQEVERIMIKNIF